MQLNLLNKARDPTEEDVKAGESCSICLDEFKVGGEKISELGCSGKHMFHLTCVKEWLVNQSKTCPVCRERVG